MSTRIDIAESNIGGLENSVNHTAHMLNNFLRELIQESRQYNNSAPPQHAPTQGAHSTKVTKDEDFSGQLK